MRANAVPLPGQRGPLVDTCGTGGGGIPTFNISTTVVFVVAACGGSVAKHGNRAMTSTCGSADVLEALGVRIDLSPERLAGCLDGVGVAFLFAQAHHPAMRHVAPIRKELPYRTVFNCLGPLANPAGAQAQVVGVYEPRLVPLLGEALRRLGCRRAIVAHGLDGLDELSTLGPTLLHELGPDGVTHSELRPETLGLPLATTADLAPGTSAAENGEIVRAVLGGERGPRRDIVLLNAAAALVVAELAPDLPAGLQRAATALDSGAALARLDALIAATQE
jgi:anthranilate phosphoribosyltransferase